MAKVHNVNGEYHHIAPPVTLQQRMEAYDLLPATLRELVANASYSVCPLDLLKWLKPYQQYPDLTAEVLREALHRATVTNARLAYGPDHPQAGENQ
jgi:hypothetical protein